MSSVVNKYQPTPLLCRINSPSVRIYCLRFHRLTAYSSVSEAHRWLILIYHKGNIIIPWINYLYTILAAGCELITFKQSLLRVLWQPARPYPAPAIHILAQLLMWRKCPISFDGGHVPKQCNVLVFYAINAQMLSDHLADDHAYVAAATIHPSGAVMTFCFAHCLPPGHTQAHQTYSLLMSGSLLNPAMVWQVVAQA